MPQLDVIGLIVADLGRAMAFYERLGLQFPENPDAEGHGHVETTLLRSRQQPSMTVGATRHDDRCAMGAPGIEPGTSRV